MGNKLLIDLTKSKIKNISEKSKVISAMKHNGLAGTGREDLLKGLLIQYITDIYDIGSGSIQDYLGNQSSETDLVLYNKSIIPPIYLANDGKAIYPMESVKYVFEVKTKSNNEEIRTTISKFNNLMNLNSLVGGQNSVQRVYFAYSSDLKIKHELFRYFENDSQGLSNPRINVICVIGKGYYFCNRVVSENRLYSQWLGVESDSDFSEVIQILIGITNTVNNVGFGSYLGVGHEFTIFTQSISIYSTGETIKELKNQNGLDKKELIYNIRYENGVPIVSETGD